ncbi:thiamine diphosphokinase [Shimia sp.]|uniref:thiamine diphosphokinase n=1 Tax=Shimia sp. TaxID=1954381 RepID=UPI0035621C04
MQDGDLDACLTLAPRLVAADGGAAHCLARGILPEAVIGDMDSCPDAVLQGIPPGRVHAIAEQDSTDFDKALRNIDAPLVLGLGFTGARIDHELACYNALLRHADRPCLLLGGSDLVFLAPPAIELPLAPGTRVSLFPLARLGGRSRGLRWPIEGLSFDPAGRVGTSNAAEGPLGLEFPEPGMLVILPRQCLGVAVRALLAPPAGSWCARG